MINKDNMIEYIKNISIVDIGLILLGVSILILIIYNWYKSDEKNIRDKKKNKNGRVRLALTCMTMKPVDFDIWLDYHFGLGIS